MVIIATLIASIIPALALFVIYKLDKFRTREFLFVIISAVAGGIAYLLAVQVNPSVQHLVKGTGNQMVRYIAPVAEEILKMLIILVLIRRPKFTYFVDGAIYGFATGIGFAICENIEYILGNQGAALATAIARVLSTNLMHAAACGVVGIVLGWARTKKAASLYGLGAAGLAVAILLHMGYNNMVTRVGGFLQLAYAVAVGAGAAFFIAFMIRRGLKDEGVFIQEKLGAQDRVERQEVAAVQQVDKLDAVLKHLEARLGPDIAASVKDLVYIQARLGIMRKTVSEMADEKLRQGTLEQVEQLRKQMEQTRRKIGPYGMAYLRYTHLEEKVSLYVNLDARIRDAALQPRAPGMGVFDRLKERAASAQEKKDTQ
jgi:RsiW-degrading membrane proteinase PrsW (M82 family)